MNLHADSGKREGRQIVGSGRSASQPWLRLAALVALAYPVVGISFAALGNLASSHRAVVAWRFAAWLVSGAAFLFHLAYEHARSRSSPLRAASRVAAAVAVGAFALAVWVLVHRTWAGTGVPSPRAPWALVVFPAVTGVPAFLVALVAVSVFVRLRPRRP
jgi:hypothetical protein